MRLGTGEGPIPARTEVLRRARSNLAEFVPRMQAEPTDEHLQRRRNPVELLAEEFLDRKRRGEQPTLREYVERHPDLADEIRDLFPALL